MAEVGTMEAHVAKMETQLKEWAAKLEEVVAKAGTTAKSDYHLAVDDMKAKLGAAQKKIEEARATGAENWETIKTGLESAWAELEATYALVTKTK